MSRWPLPLGLVIGFVADRVLGDPRRAHPVAGFGRCAAALERISYRDERGAGAMHTAALVAGAAGLGAVASHAVERLENPLARATAGTALATAATWTVLGGRSLEREALAVAGHLTDDDLPAARRRIRSLVGRDPSTLDGAGLSRAVIESVAENTADAVVAPLLWGAVAGVPGLLGYRAINTLDAMIGHRSPRYLRFGWAAARLDDVANWLPARLAAGCAIVAARAVGGSPAAALRAVRRDAHQHPSPNAGQVEAAFAGALGVRLGGSNSYDGRVENRGELGDGRPAAPADVARSTRLARHVAATSLAVAVAGALARGQMRSKTTARP